MAPGFRRSDGAQDGPLVLPLHAKNRAMKIMKITITMSSVNQSGTVPIAVTVDSVALYAADHVLGSLWLCAVFMPAMLTFAWLKNISAKTHSIPTEMIPQTASERLPRFISNPNIPIIAGIAPRGALPTDKNS